ncbi:MAG TPA: DVUA0089 family protein, partial [Bryobacteraceae bacterium]|nr:DVUA0089 family protein [Bryobacteraceae bacterium]
MNLLCRFFISLLTLCIYTVSNAEANTISYSGDLRTDATFTDCGPACTLGAANSDADYAQWAAVVETFHVPVLSTVQAVTFSYGGGTNGAGNTILPGGFEPYLSLFDSSGNFLASTLFGVTCPAGANTNPASNQCFDVALGAGMLAPGTYEIAISAFENQSFAENSGSGNLADGFTGLGNLQPGEDMHFAFD